MMSPPTTIPLPPQSRSYQEAVECGREDDVIRAQEKQQDQEELIRKSDGVSHVPCLFFKQGKCENGEGCRFSHEISRDTSKPLVCEYFRWGRCRFGKDCALLHIKVGQPDSMDEINRSMDQSKSTKTGSEGVERKLTGNRINTITPHYSAHPYIYSTSNSTSSNLSPPLKSPPSAPPRPHPHPSTKFNAISQAIRSVIHIWGPNWQASFPPQTFPQNAAYIATDVMVSLSEMSALERNVQVASEAIMDVVNNKGKDYSRMRGRGEVAEDFRVGVKVIDGSSESGSLITSEDIDRAITMLRYKNDSGNGNGLRAWSGGSGDGERMGKGRHTARAKRRGSSLKGNGGGGGQGGDRWVRGVGVGPYVEPYRTYPQHPQQHPYQQSLHATQQLQSYYPYPSTPQQVPPTLSYSPYYPTTQSYYPGIFPPTQQPQANDSVGYMSGGFGVSTGLSNGVAPPPWRLPQYSGYVGVPNLPSSYWN